MKVWYLPLEPIDKRYTSQWYRWFAKVFMKRGIDFEYVDGEFWQQSVGSKFFLDMKNTFVWKFSQLAKLFKKEIKDGDVIFIPDGEFPGIEAIEYFKRFYDVDVKVVEIWHAGTYDKADLTSLNGLGRVGKGLEEVWMDMADLIFVGSEYHKNLIVRERIVDKNKIFVTGLPVDVEGMRRKYLDSEKVKRAIFTGRLSWEKGIDVVERVRRIGVVDVYVTQEHNLSKDEYYWELAKSACVFSPARQETFGYGVIEGMALNCIPVVPNDLSYKEYVPEEWRYKDEDEMFELLKMAVNERDEDIWMCVEDFQYEYVIGKMIDLIEEKLA